MAARENEIGRCKCPVCSSTSARLRVSAKQLAYVTCNTCNVQTFARSDRSDSLLRALHIPEDVKPTPEPMPDPVKAPETKPSIKPEPVKALGWGVFG